MNDSTKRVEVREPLFQRMTVIGVGLIGGSLARACRGGLARRVVGLDADPINLNRAIGLGLVDEVGDLPVGVAGADLVVVAVPVGALAEVVRAAAPHLAPGCIVTDVGSVKGDLVAEVEREMPPGRAYVPAHPIAGTERSGPEAASAELFRGSLCVLTPTSRTPEAALTKVMRLWEGVGSRVVRMDPFRHDQIFALVSHLPHVVAYALIGTVLNGADDGEEVLRFSGGGLRDFTRIAASHPVMWRDILIRNRGEVLDSIARFRKVLERIEEMIRTQDTVRLVEEFQRAKEAREQLR
ncbi:MAG: prephenate dehydrogenase/arogenate dehydrogenase family protein [candidate division NC10 bacterium]|nr:prephenate dehydrogenase/arogenate dehydrogenase family protein [candidate division NC10 bacterium]